MCATIPRVAIGHLAASSLQAIFAIAQTVGVLVFGLSLAVAPTVFGGQPQSRHQRTGTAEIVPAPLPAVVQSRDPLTELIADKNYKDEFGGIGQVTVDIRPREVRQGLPVGDMPPNVAAGVLSSQTRTSRGKCDRNWPCICVYWEASGLSHQPLYFEETNLERYGYSPRGLRLAQPLLSAGNFYLSVLLLPYKIASEPPHEKIYTLGQYRPGSPAPYRINRPQFRLVGVAAEAAVIAGIILLIP